MCTAGQLDRWGSPGARTGANGDAAYLIQAVIRIVGQNFGGIDERDGALCTVMYRGLISSG